MCHLSVLEGLPVHIKELRDSRSVKGRLRRVLWSWPSPEPFWMGADSVPTEYMPAPSCHATVPIHAPGVIAKEVIALGEFTKMHGKDQVIFFLGMYSESQPLWPFNTVTYVVVTPTIKLFLLLLHNHNFATDMNCNLNIFGNRHLLKGSWPVG